MRKVSVYALWNEEEDAAFYVGSSVEVVTRFRYHCSGWSGGDVSLKIQKFREDGTKFGFRVLEETDEENRFDREKYWIAKMRNDGHPILNVLWLRARES